MNGGGGGEGEGAGDPWSKRVGGKWMGGRECVCETEKMKYRQTD